MPTTIRPLPFVLALGALVTGCAFLYVAVSVAFTGTGATIPTGAGVVEGTLAEGRSVRVPVGAPIQWGDIIVTDPNASRAIDHHWSSPVGEPEVVVHTASGDESLTLPHARDWKGMVQEETLQVDALDGIPFVQDHPEILERQGPPYLLVVRGLRAGDPVIARVSGDEVVELHVGDRAGLEAHLAQREGMRWPMVILMAIMGLTALALAFAAFRKARAPEVQRAESAASEA